MGAAFARAYNGIGRICQPLATADLDPVCGASGTVVVRASSGRSDVTPDTKTLTPEPPATADSNARLWRPLARFIALDARIGEWALQRPWRRFAYEFVRFGMKQAWACLFGATMLALLLASYAFYPRHAPLARYDFLVLAALAVQAAMLATKLETFEEAKVIFLFHIVGTGMEVFKTATGSWVYPEDSLLRVGGVPLFTGFMYASVGSFIARDWRLMDFRFTRHPPMWAVQALAVAIYANFFLDHYGVDLRIGLIAVAALLFHSTWIHYRVWRTPRRMPLLLANFLSAVFVWIAENLGTFAHAWLYPQQADGWRLVGLSKLASWFLLLIISYAMVATVNRPQKAPKAVRA